MAIEVTINLDSGCFLPIKKNGAGFCCEVGYFQNPGDLPDIKVFVDGEERLHDPPLKLGNNNCTIAVRHLNAKGAVKRGGVKGAPTFHKQLLHMKALYDEDIEMDRSKFECVFHFENGRFLPSMVKARCFKEARRQQDGLFASTGNRRDMAPVCHNAVVHFTLKGGEVLELVKDGTLLLSSRDLNVKRRVEIEVPVDNAVANRFYHDAFLTARADGCYWIPNDGDPPPSCSSPPCINGGGSS